MKPDTASADYLVVDRDRLADSELEGRELGGANASLMFVDAAPGEGPRLHRHPYEEIFIVMEGQVRFSVGTSTLDAHAGQIVLVRAGVPHKFVNSGSGRLRQVDIHLNSEFVTEWLEG